MTSISSRSTVSGAATRLTLALQGLAAALEFDERRVPDIGGRHPVSEGLRAFNGIPVKGEDDVARLDPALRSGLSGCNWATSAPSGSRARSNSAISAVTSCNSAPTHGRCSPATDSADFTTVFTMLAGMEKPMPMKPPEREKMAVLMPTSSPAMLTSAPPELPD